MMFIKELFLFLFVSVIIWIYLWYRRRTRTYQTFTRNGIKGPKPSLLSGNYLQIKPNLNETIDEWFGQYGEVFGYFLGERPVLVIKDLEAIQTILINKSRLFRDRPKFFLNTRPLISSLLALRGDRWRHVRKVITPSLSHLKINSSDVKVIVEKSVDICLKRIEEKSGDIIAIEDMMQSITLDVVCKYVLNMWDTDVHKDDSVLRNAAKEFMLAANNVLVTGAQFLPFLRPVLSFINNYVTAGRLTDLLLRHLNRQIQIETQNKSLNLENKTNNVLKSLLKYYWDGKLERDEVTGNAILLLLAGSDTTAMGLNYSLYLLAKHKDIQHKLRDEVICNGYYNQYVDMVWNESLRLCPPAVGIIQREAIENIVVNDIVIDSGTIVQIPIWHIHHDPNVWPDPYSFDPERFAPEYRDNRLSASFLAFGLGPRNCIGIELAGLEARLTLSKIVDKFEIEFCSATPDPLEFFSPTEILYPRQPIYLRFISLK